MAKKQTRAGRPPTYKTADEMQAVIDTYFAACRGRPLVGDDGKIFTDKEGKPIFLDAYPPTVTGLALALGFTSRQALLNYEAKAEFIDTVARAKSRVEQYAEERLFDRDGANGAKFSLENNFEGWKEKRHVEADVKSDVNISIELTDEP